MISYKKNHKNIGIFSNHLQQIFTLGMHTTITYQIPKSLLKLYISTTSALMVIKTSFQIIEWKAFLEEVPSKTVYFQVWRSRGSECVGTFRLVNQTLIQPTKEGNYTLQVDNGFEVDEGDYLGLYFEGMNPVSFQTRPCYSTEERIRYNNKYMKQDVALEPNSTMISVETPALSWEPCRSYSIQAVIGKYKQHIKVIGWYFHIDK